MGCRAGNAAECAGFYRPAASISERLPTIIAPQS
jgi:hypothetical protein